MHDPRLSPGSPCMSPNSRQTNRYTILDKWACQAHNNNARRRVSSSQPNSMSFSLSCRNERKRDEIFRIDYMSNEERKKERDCLDGGGAVDNELSVCLSVCASLGHLRGRSVVLWQKPIDHCLLCVVGLFGSVYEVKGR
ncbi:unnamed protein product [Onchocerca flexuosa]|uniref:Uncharacterized protein n=1 Tax=Onchocerca flexuosa TaxID=387005 RepID=A0A183H7F0_9BILA|nr:unnamed protein product [Onchocerca flexuosa]